ncbi:MAG TPA: chemotaxis protein CheC, partial [Bacillota bacterium]|nr:chemotaxis protein CheC [Bacillota bacterium]
MDRQILSQEEINALLQDMDSDAPAPPELTADQKDALGEIGNISYGSAATALSKLFNKRVDINTPTVFLTTQRELKEQHPSPYVLLEVDYKVG